jgi:hypothetical protein
MPPVGGTSKVMKTWGEVLYNKSTCDLRSHIWIAKAILFIWDVPTGRCKSGNGLVLSFQAESEVNRSNGKRRLGKGCMVNEHVNLCRAVNYDRRKWMIRLNQNGKSTRLTVCACQSDECSGSGLWKGPKQP